MLILKLLLIPGFLLLISLAGKRWGPSVAGWLSGLPVVVGPILFFLAIEQGPQFAAQSAVAALSAMFAMIAFCITYAQVAQRANWPWALTISLTVWAVLALDKPLIAAVAGPAIGIGTTLLLHCDQVLVSRDARLRTPFVALGVCPEFGASLLLPQMLGHARAAQLLLCNQTLNGDQAVQWGLATELYDDGTQCLAAAVTLARRLQQLPADALRISRRLLKDAQREALAATVAKEGLLFIERLNSDEAKAALTAMVSRKRA